MSKPSKAVLARRAWTLMFDFLMGTSGQRLESLSRLGLTPNDARGLEFLDASDGRTMRSLADAWGCDASNATWVVDRLERLGLAERRFVEYDRRVRHVVLTEKGRTTRADLLNQFHTPPEELLNLDRRDLERLRQALMALGGAAGRRAPSVAARARRCTARPLGPRRPGRSRTLRRT